MDDRYVTYDRVNTRNNAPYQPLLIRTDAKIIKHNRKS